MLRESEHGKLLMVTGSAWTIKGVPVILEVYIIMASRTFHNMLMKRSADGSISV